MASVIADEQYLFEALQYEARKHVRPIRVCIPMFLLLNHTHYFTPFSENIHYVYALTIQKKKLT